MVKNANGGSKAKGQARKHVNHQQNTTNTRLSHDSLEIYASVEALLGGNMFRARCVDGKQRICKIGKKFMGRNRKNNMLLAGGWVLVGLRDLIDTNPDNKCDLLEVYNDRDVDVIKSHNRNVDWQILAVAKSAISHSDVSDDRIDITNMCADDDLMASCKAKTTCAVEILCETVDDVDFGEI